MDVTLDFIELFYSYFSFALFSLFNNLIELCTLLCSEQVKDCLWNSNEFW